MYTCAIVGHVPLLDTVPFLLPAQHAPGKLNAPKSHFLEPTQHKTTTITQPSWHCYLGVNNHPIIQQSAIQSSIPPDQSSIDRGSASSTSSSPRIDHLLSFNTIFLSMIRQFDALEWPSFHQKRLSLSTPGITFSLLTRPSLLQSTRGASSTSSLRIDEFIQLQTIFSEHEPSSWCRLEWPSFDQKRLSFSTPGITFSLLRNNSIPWVSQHCQNGRYSISYFVFILVTFQHGLYSWTI